MSFDIYGGPSGIAEINNQDLLPPKQSKKSEFVNEFLSKQVPSKHLKHDDTLNSLQYKTHSLYGKKKKRYMPRQTKRRTLTSKEKKDLKLFAVNPKDQRYEYFLPLHELWKDYMQDLINFDRISNKTLVEVEQKLLKADYHGSLIEVTKGKCPSLIGQKGIMFQETKNTWKIIREDHEVKKLIETFHITPHLCKSAIPKQNTVVSMELKGYQFSIHGQNFKFKTSERSSRKFKGFLSVDM